jgi:hypothetical protein
MKLIEFGAVRIGAAIQNICTNVDFDVLSLPGGSLIAVVLWFYAGAAGSVRHVTKFRWRTIVCGAGRCCASPAPSFLIALAPLVRQARAGQHIRCLGRCQRRRSRCGCPWRRSSRRAIAMPDVSPRAPTLPSRHRLLTLSARASRRLAITAEKANQ